MATKKTNKPKASNYTKQIATRMDVIFFAKLLAASLGNDRWLTENVIKDTFSKSGPEGTIKKDTVKKATKIPKLESEDKMINSLMSIHDLLKKNYDDKLKANEKKNQFMVEQSIERKKQNEEFIKALQSANGSSTIVNTTATKINDDNSGGLLGDLLGVGKMLVDIGKFFMTTPLGLGLLLGLSTLYALWKDEHADETNKGIQNAGQTDGGLGSAIQESRADEVSSRKAVILREAHKNGIIKASWPDFKKQGQEEKDYLKSIGFDEKTGLTQKDRDNGYNAVDENGNPYFSKSRATETKQETNTEVAPASTSSPAPQSSNSELESLPTPTPSPSATSAAPTSTSLSSGESVVNAPPSAPAQIPSPNVSQKLDVVNDENLEMKLPQAPSDRGMIITNNEKTKGQKGSNRVPLPSVRNAEETFQRMILNSTRVV